MPVCPQMATKDKKADRSGGIGTVSRTSSKTNNHVEKKKKRPGFLRNNAAVHQKGNQKAVLDVEIREGGTYKAARESKEMLRKRTGIVFDSRMAEHKCLWDENYPECPDRFTKTIDRCGALGLISRCTSITPRQATEEEILTLHSQEQIDILKATENCVDDDHKLEKLSSQFDAIYIHPTTYYLSLLAAGSTIELVDAICSNKIQNGMAIVRPPGHHAMKSEYCGYCFFNNVALAAVHALNKHQVSRILIVDWDVHHGQATQQMFYDDPRIVYFSIHRYEHGSFWPNLRESEFDYIGKGNGQGYNFNVPLNKTGMTDSDYLAVFQQVLLPMAIEFQPELILVSAGYDAAIGCPEGEMEITPACYSHLLSPLLSLAKGKVAVILEGGYCLKSLAEGAALTLRCLLGDPSPPLPSLPPPCESIQETIFNVIFSHRSFWKCYQFQETYSLKDMNSLHHLSGVKKHLPVIKFLGNEEKPVIYETRNCYPVQSTQFLKEVDEKLNSLILRTDLSFAPHRVCFVYDENMMKHRNIDDPSHPESPDRILSIYTRLMEFELLDRIHLLKLPPRIISEEELSLLHSEKHILKMQETKHMNMKELKVEAEKYNSVYLHQESYECARLAAGSLLQVVDSVLNGESRSGIAIIRPPGHHAEEDEACGFCIFNNVSIAAKYAVEMHGLKRVLLLDWDVHHGNGSQHMFESDPRVLYISLHRYDNGHFFPGSTDANYTVVGTGAGEGFNINIPWNKRGISDPDYVAAFFQIVMPICYQYAPELVLVSAGFDAAVNDKLGGCKLTPEAYGHFTHWLSSLSNGKIILSLEGGYNLTSISYAMTMCVKALLGDPLPPLSVQSGPCPSAVTTIKNVINVHSQYWSCLKFCVALPKGMLGEMSETLDKSQGIENSLEKLSLKQEMTVNVSKEYNYGLNQNTFLGSSGSSYNSSCITSPEESSATTGSQAWSEINSSVDSSPSEHHELSSTNVIMCNHSVSDCCRCQSNDIEISLSKSNVFKDGAIIHAADNGSKDQTKKVGNVRENAEGSNSEGATSAQNSGRQTLVDYLSDNMQLLVSGQMHAVIPLRSCPHLDTVQEVPARGIDINLPCLECGSTEENWICLYCYTVHCSRFVNEHMMLHSLDTSHPLTLSFSDLSVWCYACEAYVDNEVLYHVKNAVHRSKFGEDLPWSYGE